MTKLTDMSEVKLKGRVLGKNIMLRPIQVETRSPGGLILPDAPKEKPDSATVVLIGEEVKRVEVGAVIMFHEHSVHPVEINGVTYLRMSEDHITYIL